MLFALDHYTPKIDPTAWVADCAKVIGNVNIGSHSSVWFGTVIRADHNITMEIGAHTNIQDNCILHTDSDLALSIGDGVTVGHGVILHGCTIGSGSLIGLGAIVMNRARIGKRCLVAAGALITEDKFFADDTLIVGSPARALRSLREEEYQYIEAARENYIKNATRFRTKLVKIA